jgi:hypothetical protein
MHAAQTQQNGQAKTGGISQKPASARDTAER